MGSGLQPPFSCLCFTVCPTLLYNQYVVGTHPASSTEVKLGLGLCLTNELELMPYHTSHPGLPLVGSHEWTLLSHIRTKSGGLALSVVAGGSSYTAWLFMDAQEWPCVLFNQQNTFREGNIQLGAIALWISWHFSCDYFLSDFYLVFWYGPFP